MVFKNLNEPLSQSNVNTKGTWQSVPKEDDEDTAVKLMASQPSYKSTIDDSPCSIMKSIPMAKSKVQIQVVAPATLPEGYEFDAKMSDGSLIKVKVPAGGIEDGQTFNIEVPIPIASTLTTAGMNGINDSYFSKSDSDSIPVGHWRDDWYECFRYGVCHPHCWTGLCCPLLAVGQVITRLELNWLANPASNVGEVVNSFRILFAITVIHFFFIGLVYVILSLDVGKPPTVEDIQKLDGFDILVLRVNDLLKWLYLIIASVWAYRVRKVVRAKYALPGTGCCDCLLSFFCMCCSVNQMLRHTTDYDKYHSRVCTSTGLAPVVHQSTNSKKLPLATIV